MNINEEKLDAIMGVIRTFVCNTSPNIHGRTENYLHLTYKDASVLASEVANLRINLARAGIEVQRVVQQRDDLHSFYMGISEKFRAVDPLWNENQTRSIEHNVHTFLDNLLRSAGVLRDEPDGCQACDDKYQRIEELQEEINLHREKAREVVVQARDTLEGILPHMPGTIAAAAAINTIQRAIASCVLYLEDIP